jgi:hypothetical protein
MTMVWDWTSFPSGGAQAAKNHPSPSSTKLTGKELIDLRNTLCAHNPKTTAGTTSTSS